MSHVPMLNLYFNPVSLMFSQFETNRFDWAYICFDSSITNTQWIRYANTNRDSNLYEPYFNRSESSCAAILPASVGLESWDPIPHADLFSPHPTKPNHWKFECRITDLIELSPGNQINPLPFEQCVSGHPLVEFTMLFSATDQPIGSRNKLIVLIQLHDPLLPTDIAGRNKRLDTIWPSVKEANSILNDDLVVESKMVMFATPEKPFVTDDMGEIVRSETEKLYATEIEELQRRWAS
jgi:hypothetical protein